MAPNLGRGRWRQLDRLLNMMYRPAEISEEIGISVDSFYRTYMPAGAPVETDAHGKLWINGARFRSWARETFREKVDRPRMAANQVYCVKCRARVVPVSVETLPHPKNQRLVMLVARCPTCGRKAVRYKAVRP